MKKISWIFFLVPAAFVSSAQMASYSFELSGFTIDFGRGNILDIHNIDLSNYQKIRSSCPADGYYSFAPYTSACFGEDWHWISEDHTEGDIDGNMLMVNTIPGKAVLLRIPITGLKSNTIYALDLWLMNLCKPKKNCSFPLSPNLNIRLETAEGMFIENIATTDLPRTDEPKWMQHQGYFTTPASTTSLQLVISDNTASNCGNDFALDDITIREFAAARTKQPLAQKNKSKNIFSLLKKKNKPARTTREQEDMTATTGDDQLKIENEPVRSVLHSRENVLAKEIEAEAGEIRIEVYDNGEIDGDSVSIYHNNSLVCSQQKLSQKPISFTIHIDAERSQHEIIMVADNLGTIPPNTSVMIITTKGSRYAVFISSNEQKNARVVFTLKK